MKEKTSPKNKNIKLSTEREPYEAPAIIHEGLITTVAGSGGADSDKPDIDPANVFQSTGG